jgi:hypothetical protein
MLGLQDERVLQLSVVDCMRATFDSCTRSTADVRAILQTMSPMEIIPSSFSEVSECLHLLPVVIEWQQRSAYRHRVTQGLALGKAHFPFDWEHDDVLSGWPAESGEVDHVEVLKLKVEAVPYADRLLRMDDLLPYQATVDAPGDSPAEQHDHNIEQPFAAARAGALTTFVVNPWISGYQRRELAEKGEPSSKATGGADDEGGKGSE